jgi:hypothetical protein
MTVTVTVHSHIETPRKGDRIHYYKLAAHRHCQWQVRSGQVYYSAEV